MLWQILVQFLFRLAFGLSGAMACTSPKWVTSGFYRVHLWVGMGLNTFVAVLAFMFADQRTRQLVIPVAVVAGVLSYVGAVVWLYERQRAGQVVLWLVTIVNLMGALVTASPQGIEGVSPTVLADVITAGMLLGTTMAAMLLGHWYLNTPTMRLDPLRKLVLLMVVSVVLRAVVAGLELPAMNSSNVNEPARIALLSLRWIAGLAGVFGLAAMTWQTLKIPNTQSATGILYVAVIFSFLGELTSQLLFV